MKIALIVIAVIAVLLAAFIIATIIFGNNNTKKDILLRYYLVFVIIGTLFSAVVYRIWYLQYVEGDQLRAIAERRWTGPDTIKAHRGNILSDDGRLMASSLPTYFLYMDLRVQALKVKDKDGRTYFDKNVKALADSLSVLFKDKSSAQYEKDLRKAYQRKSAHYLLYPKRVSYTDYKRVSQFPILKRGAIQGGFSPEERVTRVKPFGSLASRTIGNIYGIAEKGGSNGLELYYDSILRGTSGLKVRRKMAGRRTDIILKQPEDGLDVVSTINIDLQETVEKELLQELQRINAECGTAIVMEVPTGRVKAISNFSRDSKGNYRESVNIAVASQIEPGSTFKTMSCMVALDDGVIDTSTVVNTGNGGYRFANRIMKDWNYGGPNGGFGTITLAEAMYQSSNVGISVLIDKYYSKDRQKFVDGLKATGIADRIDLELPGHGRVRIKDTDDKTWSETTLPWMSIGYEVQVPPIFMLMMYNAIANGGTLVKPQFAQGIQKNGTMVEEFQPEVIKQQICSPETLGKLQSMLLGVVEQGTAKQVKSELFPIAGKTGTSQIFEGGSNRNTEGRIRHQITFCGYFPADKPMYSCLVYIKEPQGAASAGRMCGTVFKHVAEKAYILNVRKSASDSISVN